jgi:beta-galactosidase
MLSRISALPWLRLSVLLAASCLAACAVKPEGSLVSAPGHAQQALFNDGWLFKLEDAAGADAASFDDAAWRKLSVPHDWSIEQPFDQKWASGTGFLPGGIAWYRKHFALAPDQIGKTLLLRFDGIYKNSTVYINGQKLGERPCGYISFEYDLTPYLNANGDNVLAVRVDHKDYADSRWYPGSGIFRNVYLSAAEPVRVARYGSFVSTAKASEDSASIKVETAVQNDTDRSVSVDLTLDLLDHRGKDVDYIRTAGEEGPFTVPAKSTRVFTRELTFRNPQLWTLERPSMYTVVTHIGSPFGHQYDTYTTPFGVRTATFDSNTGFALNGAPMKIKGVCLHEDAGGLGSAIPQQVWERRLLLLRSAGVNAIRCSHNPPAPEFLDLCDRLGFLVMDEAFDEWSKGKKKWVDTWSGTEFKTDGYNAAFEKWSDTDIEDMVRRDRNHPSIILWSIGNEVDYPNDPYPPNSEELRTIATRLIGDVKRLDNTRPITAACASIATNLWYKDLDVIGYNYQESRYSADHAAMPEKVILGSENSHSLAAWNAVADNAFISAQFLWTGVDYMGEAGRPAPGTKNAWPERSRPDGFLDLAGFPKPMYWFRKSLWNDQPMVKIDFNLPVEQADKTLAVPPGLACYTNCDSVEFFQNGASLGDIPLPKETRIIKVPGDPAAGTIKAVGKKGGQAVADVQDVFAKSGPPAKIELWNYPSLLGPGDGSYVAQIELSLLDSTGVVSRDAANDIKVTLEGPGRILALESGDIASHESYQDDHHKAFHGRLIIYVQAQSRVTVTAAAADLPGATITVGPYPSLD